MFDELIVAIGINPDKRSTYAVAEGRICCAILLKCFPTSEPMYLKTDFWLCP